MNGPNLAPSNLRASDVTDVEPEASGKKLELVRSSSLSSLSSEVTETNADAEESTNVASGWDNESKLLDSKTELVHESSLSSTTSASKIKGTDEEVKEFTTAGSSWMDENSVLENDGLRIGPASDSSISSKLNQTDAVAAESFEEGLGFGGENAVFESKVERYSILNTASPAQEDALKPSEVLETHGGWSAPSERDLGTGKMEKEDSIEKSNTGEEEKNNFNGVTSDDSNNCSRRGEEKQEEESKQNNTQEPKNKTTWFAKYDTEVTRKLRTLLENQDQDERCIDESEFHFQRRGINRIYPNDDERLDLWSSTGYHYETPRATLISTICRDNLKDRHFLRGDAVIFPDPRPLDPVRPEKHAEWTGRIIESPFNEQVSVRAQRTLHRTSGAYDTKSSLAVVRRGGGDGNALYKVEVVAKRILGGILAAQEHEYTKIIDDYITSRRSRGGRSSRKHRANYELLHISVLESPDECRRRKLTRVVQNWLLRYLRQGVSAWIELVYFQREQERRLAATIRLQAFARFLLSRKLTLEKRLAAQLAWEHRQRTLEAERLAALEAERRAQHEAYLREHGVTRDGIRFFETEEAMAAFYERMEAMCKRIEIQVGRLASGLKAQAIERWKYYLNEVLPPAHLDVEAISQDVGGLRSLLSRELGCDETCNLGDLTSKLSRIADLETERLVDIRAKSSFLAPWHAQEGIRLPPLASPGARLLSTGVVRVDDTEQLERFRKFHAGPTDCTAWLARGAGAKLLFGAFPRGQAFPSAKGPITSRSGAVISVLLAGIGTFVSLIEPEELLRLESGQISLPMESDAKEGDERVMRRSRAGSSVGVSSATSATQARADALCAELRAELMASLRAAEEASKSATQRANRAREVGYGATQREALERAEADRAREVRRAREALDAVAERLHHLQFSMPRGGDGGGRPKDDARIIALLRELELRLRRRERVFIFSTGGGGRAGAIAALLLARLYGLPAHEALRRVQRHHDAMPKYRGMRPENIPACPRTQSQRAMVERLLASYDAALDTIATRGLVPRSMGNPDEDHESSSVTVSETVIATIREGSRAVRGGLLPLPEIRF